jgi:hypothetical protein
VDSTVIRLSLGVLALLVGAWLVLSFRSIELADDGAAVLAKAQRGHATREEVSRGLSSLRRAERFSADHEPLFNEAFLLGAVGRQREAIHFANRLVDKEPANLEGWVVVYLGSLELGDRERAADARRRVRALNPMAEQTLRRLARVGS